MVVKNRCLFEFAHCKGVLSFFPVVSNAEVSIHILMNPINKIDTFTVFQSCFGTLGLLPYEKGQNN